MGYTRVGSGLFPSGVSRSGAAADKPYFGQASGRAGSTTAPVGDGDGARMTGPTVHERWSIVRSVPATSRPMLSAWNSQMRAGPPSA